MIRSFFSVKRKSQIVSFLLVVMHASALNVFAAPAPTSIFYQGFLTSATGAAQSGTATVTVRLYDSSTGGSLLFEELHPTTAVANGYFSVQIGSVGDVNVTTTAAAISDLSFDKSYYLTIELSAPFSTGEMTLTGGARSQLGTVPFSTVAYGTLQATSSSGLVTQKGRMYFNTNDNQLYVYDGTSWNAVGISGAGVTSLNGLTGSSQSFTVATSGSDVTVTSTGTVHTLAIPDAGLSSRGVVSTSAQTFTGNKTFTGTTTSNGLVATVLNAITAIFNTLTSGTITATSSLSSQGTLDVSGQATLATASATALSVSGQTYLNTASSSALSSGNLFTTGTTTLATSGGYVGIGIGQPTALLDVTGSTTAGQAASGNLLHLYNTSAEDGSYAGILFHTNEGNDNRRAQIYSGKETSTSIDGLGSGRGYLGFSTRATGGTAGWNERLRISSVGKIGVGTTTPFAWLDVLGVGTTSPLLQLTNFAASATTTRFIVTADGRVGIGSSTPWSTLSVQGDAYIGGSLVATGTVSISGQSTLATTSATSLTVTGQTTLNTASATGITSTNIYGTNANITNATSSALFATLLNAVTAAITNLTVTNATATNLVTLGTTTFATTGGNVGIGTTSPRTLLDITSSNPIFTLTDTDGGYNQISGNGAFTFMADAGNTQSGSRFAFEIDGTEQMRLNTTGGLSLGSTYVGTNPGAGSMIMSGSLGIGTTTPAYKLDVVGDTNISSGSVYRINGAIVAQASTTLNNYFFGAAGNLTSTGSNNTGVGQLALSGNTSGAQNVAIGRQALTANTSGAANVAMGFQALSTATTSTGNTAIGHQALRLAQSVATGNTAVGYLASDAVTTGANNTTLGYQAGMSLNTGTNNVMIGFGAGKFATSSIENVVIGSVAGQNITQTGIFGIGETLVGYNAGNAITTGTYNTFIGNNAAKLVTTGGSNTGVGRAVFNDLTTGGFNTGLGHAAGFYITTGIGNLCLGNSSCNNPNTLGSGNLTGSYNAGIGEYAGATADGLTNAWAIGNYASVASSNALVIGSASSTWAVNVGIGTSSPIAKLDVWGNLNVATGSTPTLFANTATGNVGIGTSTPTQLLDVSGNLALSSTTPSIYAGDNFRILDTADSNRVRFVFSSNNQYDTRSSGAHVFLSGGSEKMRIAATGNVGIGTTTPAFTLDVNGTARFGNNTTGVDIGTGAIRLTGSGARNIYTSGYSSQLQLDGSTIALNTNSGGNVGIGTTTPSTLLSVAGTLNVTGQTALVTASATAFTTASFYNTTLFGSTAFLGTTTNTFDSSKLVVYGTSTLQATSSSSPLALRVMGNIDNTATSTISPRLIVSTSTGNSPVSVSVLGNYAYVANYSSNSLSIIDISNPQNPKTATTTQVGGAPQAVHVVGRYAYIANYASSTLSIIDVSNPSNPVTVSTPSTGLNPYSVYVSGRYAYVPNFTGNSISIIDVSNPSLPVTVSTLSAGTNPLSVMVVGKYLYVTNYGSSNMRIVDVSNPATPTSVSAVSVGNSPQGIYVSGRYAYVPSINTNTLSIIDISNPISPTVVSSPSTQGQPIGVTVSGKYAYVANYASGTVSVLDVSNPTSVQTVSNFSTATGGGPLPIWIQVVGRYLYVTNSGLSKLNIYDIGGVESTSALIHSLETGNLAIRNDVQVGGMLNVVTGATFGASGIIASGASAFNVSATTSLATVSALSVSLKDTSTSTILDALSLERGSSGAVLSGVGTGILFNTQASDGYSTSSARIASILTNVSSSSPSSAIVFQTKNSATGLSEKVRLTGNGSLLIGTTTESASLFVQGSSTANPFIVSSSTGSSLFSVFANGNVAIGTSTSGSQLDIVSTVTSTSTDMFRVITDVGSPGNVVYRIKANGDIFTDGNTTIGTPADLAENYPTDDIDVVPGIVVSLSDKVATWSQGHPDGSTTNYEISTVQKATPGTEALGVISTRPGILLGGSTEKGVPVAFSGRVPVYVSNENGLVKRGDPLTVSSSTPGYAMKLTSDGQQIGRALSDQSIVSTSSLVMMVVEQKHRTIGIASMEGLAILAVPAEPLKETVKEIISSQLVRGARIVREYVAISIKGVVGYFDTLFAKHIYTETLCIKKADGTNICLNGDQIENVLNATNIPLLEDQGLVSGSTTDDSQASDLLVIPGGSSGDNGSSTSPIGSQGLEGQDASQTPSVDNETAKEEPVAGGEGVVAPVAEETSSLPVDAQ